MESWNAGINLIPDNIYYNFNDLQLQLTITITVNKLQF